MTVYHLVDHSTVTVAESAQLLESKASIELQGSIPYRPKSLYRVRFTVTPLPSP